LVGIIPSEGLKEWHSDATKVVEAIKDQPVIAQILTCEEFERETGRFEIIYGVDLLFDGKESIVDYLIDEKLACRVSLNFYSDIGWQKIVIVFTSIFVFFL
jgi:hypothetical protein